MIQTGIGAAAAIGGGFAGAWMHGRNQQRAERQQRRGRAAEVMAEVAALLDDLEIFFPDVPDASDDPDKLDELIARWDQVRVRLFAIGAAHPSVEVRVLMQALGALILVCLACVEGKVEEAKKRYGEARDMLRQLVEAIQRS